MGMSNPERIVSEFLTSKNFRWVFHKTVSVKDEEGDTRIFKPDFYLTDLDIYIEVCGVNRKEDYERRNKIYKKNKVRIIFVEYFKGEKKWKHYLLQRIKEIQYWRQSKISTIKPSKPKSEVKPNYNKVKEEISNHLKEIERVKFVETPKPEITQSEDNNISNNGYFSIQSKIGVTLIFIGILLFIISTTLLVINNLILFVIIGVIGVVIFIYGLKIITYRFSQWYSVKKDNFDEWIKK